MESKLIQTYFKPDKKFETWKEIHKILESDVCVSSIFMVDKYWNCTIEIEASKIDTACSITPFLGIEASSLGKVHTSASPRHSNWPAFLGYGILLTGAIAYAFYEPTPIFPKPIKEHLRKALRSEKKSEIDDAQEHFRVAYEISKGKIDWMKRSGIGIRWATMLENLDRLEEAKKIYEIVYADLLAAKGLTEPERMRAVAVAHKLAVLSQDDQDIEAYLTWSVEEVLRITLPTDQNQENQQKIIMGEIELPEWASGAQVGPCLEALGDFYARKNHPKYSLPLYLQALSILLPPPPRRTQPTISDKCHAATLMNNIAHLLVPSSIQDATSWASRSLAVAETALAIDPSAQECLGVKLVAFQNLGTLAEMEGKRDKAREWFSGAKDLASMFGLESVVGRARDGLSRVGVGEDEQEKTIIIHQHDLVKKA
ncbi:hypothetical protein CROQUDRAFT_132927 [Cronartium quercuum f. sp. fusiforme G11]|uniref:Uncharacterized protein n=1 Tax=Cronartium quercuum f. sp. fusiforme G11 TaxID=708437 RepID=A0A9P6NJI4_9BASI|nr:hypothetical protein CROQUDRAFT_132927 [Cronartium quercuum f. sp. fusiforme G11]